MKAVSWDDESRMRELLELVLNRRLRRHTAEKRDARARARPPERSI